MKNLFYILALLVTGGAAYFSWEVNKKFQEEHTKINSEYEDFGVGLIALNDRHEATIKTTDAELTTEEDLLETARKLLAEREASIEAAKSNERTLLRDKGATDATLEEQQVTLDEAAAAIEEVKKIVEEAAGANVTLETLPDVVRDIEEEKKQLTDQLEELEQLVAAGQKNLAQNQDEMSRLADRKAKRDSRIRRNAMEAVVTAVNYEWGFVVVGAGKQDGFTPQTTVLVKRDGRVLGQLKPTSIEQSQTIFEIDFDTMAPGVRVRPGDRVFLDNPKT